MSKLNLPGVGGSYLRQDNGNLKPVVKPPKPAKKKPGLPKAKPAKKEA